MWADMLPAHLVSAAHYQATRHQLTQTGLMKHSANMYVQSLLIKGLLRSKLEGRVSFETASTTMVFLQVSLLRA